MLGTLSAPFIANHPTHRIVHSFGFSSQNIFFCSIRRIVVQDETNDPINDDKGHNDDWVDHLGYKLNHLRKD